MAIDQATLEQYITDVAGEDKELAETLRTKFGTNEKAATNFMGGFMRHGDYTKKTQGLATQQKKFEDLQNDYETRISQAESEKDRIMKDLANERISGSKAQVLLKTVQEAYGLTADDLPGLDDIRQTVKTGRVVDSTPDIDERLKSFKADILKEISGTLIPEISGLAILGPVWNDMSYEHERLFGKRLSKADQTAILEQARKENRSLESVWTDKYNVADKRLEVRDSENKNKWRQEWEDDRSKRDQEAALSGLRPEADPFNLADRQSPLFKRDFSVHVDHESGSGNTKPPAAPAPKLRGAEAAAAKFVERASTGQLGKPLEARKTA